MHFKYAKKEAILVRKLNEAREPYEFWKVQKQIEEIIYIGYQIDIEEVELLADALD